MVVGPLRTNGEDRQKETILESNHITDSFNLYQEAARLSSLNPQISFIILCFNNSNAFAR